MNPFIRIPTKGEGGYVLVNMLQITSVFRNMNDDRANIKLLYEVNAIQSTATMAEVEALMHLDSPPEPDNVAEVEEPSSGRKRKR